MYVELLPLAEWVVHSEVIEEKLLQSTCELLCYTVAHGGATVKLL